MPLIRLKSIFLILLGIVGTASCKGLKDVFFDDDRLYYYEINDPHTGHTVSKTIGVSSGKESQGGIEFRALERALKGNNTHNFIQVFKKENMKEALEELERSPITHQIMYNFKTSNDNILFAACSRPLIYNGKIINPTACHYKGKYQETYYTFIFDIEDVYNYSIVKEKGEYIRDFLITEGKLN
jgi:hypothetical protein